MKSLTNVIIKNSRRRDRKSSKKDQVLSFLVYMIVFSFLSISMGLASYFITKKLIEINQPWAFINIVLFLNFILLIFKGVFEGLNSLYFSKDLKLLLRMPIKSKDIIKAKILNMIISEYEMEIIMLGIPIAIFGLLTKVGLSYYLYMLLILIFIPVIPLSIMSTVVAIIMNFTNKIKNKTKSMYVTIIIAVLLIQVVSGYFSIKNNMMNSSFESALIQTDGLAKRVSDSFVLIKPIMNILSNYNNLVSLKNIIIYIIESIVCLYISIYLISFNYLKCAISNTVSQGEGIRKNYKNSRISIFECKSKNKYVAYLDKELKILFRTPIFFIQCIIMPLMFNVFMFFIFNIFIKFSSNNGIDIFIYLKDILLKSFGQVLFFIVGQIVYMLSFSSIIAFSKESKNSVISKYIPISLIKQSNLKILVGVFINLISSIIITFVYYYFIKDFGLSVVVFTILVLMNIFSEKMKILIDLNNPKINWDNEYAMMKQNTNVMNVLFFTIIIIIVLSLLGFIIRDVYVFLFSILAIEICLNLGMRIYFRKNDCRIFEKLY